MYLKRKNLKKAYLQKHLALKNNEGIVIPSFTQSSEFLAEVYPASGRLLSEVYGIRLAYMLNMNTQSNFEFKEGDGIGFVSKNAKVPEYLIVAIEQYTFHKRILLESVR